MLKKSNKQILGLAMSVSLLVFNSVGPIGAFSLGLGKIKDKVEHPFGGGEKNEPVKPAATTAPAAPAAPVAPTKAEPEKEAPPAATKDATEAATRDATRDVPAEQATPVDAQAPKPEADPNFASKENGAPLPGMKSDEAGETAEAKPEAKPASSPETKAEAAPEVKAEVKTEAPVPGTPAGDAPFAEKSAVITEPPEPIKAPVIRNEEKTEKAEGEKTEGKKTEEASPVTAKKHGSEARSETNVDEEPMTTEAKSEIKPVARPDADADAKPETAVDAKSDEKSKQSKIEKVEEAEEETAEMTAPPARKRLLKPAPSAENDETEDEAAQIAAPPARKRTFKAKPAAEVFDEETAEMTPPPPRKRTRKTEEEAESDEVATIAPSVKSKEGPLARPKAKQVYDPYEEAAKDYENSISHPKPKAKKYYNDEGEEMDASEYQDEQDRKRKAKQLKDMLAPAGKPADNDPEPHIARSRALMKQRNFEASLKEINEALRLQKDNWEAHYQGALILQTAGRTKEAIEQYKYLVDVKPDYLDAHINLGACYTKEGEFDKAVKEYKQAIELKFYSLSAHYNLANVYIRQERLDDALKELKICMKFQPNNAWVHNNLGVIYQKRNYLEEALEEFTRALNLEPANHTFESNIYLVRGQMKKKPVRSQVAPVRT